MKDKELLHKLETLFSKDCGLVPTLVRFMLRSTSTNFIYRNIVLTFCIIMKTHYQESGWRVCERKFLVSYWWTIGAGCRLLRFSSWQCTPNSRTDVHLRQNHHQFWVRYNIFSCIVLIILYQLINLIVLLFSLDDSYRSSEFIHIFHFNSLNSVNNCYDRSMKV